MKQLIKFFVGFWSVYLSILVSVIGVFLIFVDPLVGVMALTFALLINLSKPKNYENISIKYFDSSLSEIQKINVGDWIDLRSAETVSIKAGDYRLIRLGVGMILPDGYEAHVLPRSSTPDKFGIMCANSMGIIDNSYSGDSDEWKFPAVAIRDTVIKKGDRIAQFRIVENQPSIVFKIVDRLNSISRGGLGSTGKR